MTERMESIYKKDKEENKEFDEAVKDGDLDSLREGVKIRQKQNLNPINAISELAGTWDTGRREHIENIAQGTDKFVTNLTGNEWIGDRARNIAGFATDITYPESWELPLMATAAAIPIDGPLGEASIYGTGVINRGRRLFKQGGQAVAANFANVINDVWQSGTRWTRDKFGSKQLVTPDGMVMRYGPDDLPPDFIPGNVPRPLPGEKHVSGLVPRISGKFNGKTYTNTTLDSDMIIPWDKVNKPQEKGRQLAGAFVDKTSNPKKWNELNNAIKARMEKLYPGWDIPLGSKSIGGWAGHHTAPVKQMAWSVNGLSNEARDEATDYMAKRIGQRLGYNPENLKAIPVEFHKYVHRLLNDALGTYDISKIEKAMGLEPGGFAKLELWERKKGFDMITDNINQSKKDIKTFMEALAKQSRQNDISPEVLVDSMEELLELQARIRLGPGDITLNQIMNKYLKRSKVALNFVNDEIPAAERPIKNILYRLALEDLDKAKKFARSQRGGTPGGPDFSPGMFPDD